MEKMICAAIKASQPPPASGQLGLAPSQLKFPSCDTSCRGLWLAPHVPACPMLAWICGCHTDKSYHHQAGAHVEPTRGGSIAHPVGSPSPMLQWLGFDQLPPLAADQVASQTLLLFSASLKPYSLHSKAYIAVHRT